MRIERDIHDYFDPMVAHGLCASAKSLRFQMNTVFKGLQLGNKRVLDIGGGTGVHSFYAAYKGAKQVTCLEPEGEGSSKGVWAKVDEVNQVLQLKNLQLIRSRFQDFDFDGEVFDIILLYNSVNHLNEAACLRLSDDPASKAEYAKIFRKMSSLCASGAHVIIDDCSRYNFFQLFRIRNPISPSIEWNKHHAPNVWVELLRHEGFVNPCIAWSSPKRFRTAGRMLFGNRFMSYFLVSHFPTHDGQAIGFSFG